MPFKDKQKHREWARNRRKNLSEEQLHQERAYFRIKAKEYYWRHPERCRQRAKANRTNGISAKQQASSRDRITKSYVRRCLIQRGWSDEDIATWINDPELIETIRVQIMAKREIRKCLSVT